MLLVCCCPGLPGSTHGSGRARRPMGRQRGPSLGPTAPPANPSPLATCTKPCLLRPRAVRWAANVWSEGTAGWITARGRNTERTLTAAATAACTKPCLRHPHAVRWATNVWPEGMAGWITARGRNTGRTPTAAAAAANSKHCSTVRQPLANPIPCGTASASGASWQRCTIPLGAVHIFWYLRLELLPSRLFSTRLRQPRAVG